MLDDALTLAARGFAVFPLKVQSKEPATAHGFKDATHDPEVIRQWWGNGQTHNLGIATGAISGIVVVDIDRDKGGDLTYGNLYVEHGAFSQTLTCATGNGLHLYFQHPGHDVRNTAGKLGAGIDRTGDGGYVVGPGSVHPNGTVYRFTGDFDELAPLPGWIDEQLGSTWEGNGAPEPSTVATSGPIPGDSVVVATPYALAALRERVSELGALPHHPSNRNDELNKAAFRMGHLIGGGQIAENEVRAALEHVALKIGLEPRKIPLTVSSGIDKGKLDPEYPKRPVTHEVATPRGIQVVQDHHLPEPAATDDAQPDPRRARFDRHLVVGDAMLELPEPEWLIDKLVPLDAQISPYGPPKSFKSFLTIAWSLSIATGAWWMGHEVRQGPVFYVATESPAGFGRRIRAWLTYNNIATSGDITWLTMPVNLFDDGEMVGILIDKLLEVRPVFIVFDTFIRCATGANENSSSDVAKVLNTGRYILEVLRDAGQAATICYDHHAGKDVTLGMRGSNALAGDVDAAFSLERTERWVTVTNPFQRDAEEDPPLRLKFHPVGNSGVLIDARDVRSQEDLDGLSDQRIEMLAAILDLDEGAGATSTEVCKSVPFDLAARTARWHLAAMVSDGWLTANGSDRRRRYQLSDLGKRLLSGKRQ